MKLLASDFDNTLWFRDHMKENDVKAIHQFQQDGHLFGVCTGRNLYGIIHPSQPYHIDYDFYILLSGSLILNKDKEIIFEKKIPIRYVQEIFDFIDHKDMSIVYQGTMYKIYQSKQHDNYGIYIDSLHELKTDTVSAFSFHYEANEIEQASLATKKINEKYGDVIVAYQNNQHIDIAAKGCSKGHGIKMIQEYFQLSMNDIYGIGDSWNDLPMLDAIEKSYTFTYAPPVVQQHAQKIVHSLAECLNDIEKM
ncbi:HAD-IIB family hydrolase [Candidatus Stoquefichus massiliensis]|uniref:HAD-IIB family hydrolase n=1 Tax=Candidatus Stoquefichus massiliensis TaxID=1470350 RepID=UPI00048550A7|nr:HAD-IIB family hydrolase [Candidatus Stoquefichus massiliensis]